MSKWSIPYSFKTDKGIDTEDGFELLLEDGNLLSFERTVTDFSYNKSNFQFTISSFDFNKSRSSFQKKVEPVVLLTVLIGNDGQVLTGNNNTLLVGNN